MNSDTHKPKNMAQQGVSWAWFVFFSQIPFVLWYAQGGPALHPIAVMLPLAGILNFSVEKRDRESLGLTLVYPGRSLMIALVYAGLSILGKIIACLVDGAQFRFDGSSAEQLWELAVSFLVSVFIIASWEEIVNRGYIQTRLQAAWGFWGVIITALLFAVMHIPSTLLDYENDLMMAAIRFLETGLAGFALGYIYWCTRSVLTTIAIHGLDNFFATGLLPYLTGISAQQAILRHPTGRLVWLIGQVLIVMYLSKVFFKRDF
jgi:membrane protease YdiL (CAAX protease family)